MSDSTAFTEDRTLEFAHAIIEQLIEEGASVSDILNITLTILINVSIDFDVDSAYLLKTIADNFAATAALRNPNPTSH